VPAVKIPIEQIQESEKSLDFEQETQEVNQALALSNSMDYRFHDPVKVHVDYYRSGNDLFFRGHLAGPLAGTCARCLGSFPLSLERDFALVLKPEPTSGPRDHSDRDEALAFYRGDEVDLSPLLREEILLALPTRPLCREECSGLCPQCGIDRNAGSCDCATAWTDPRLQVLRSLKIPSSH
jgi:uncharacterized protein